MKKQQTIYQSVFVVAIVTGLILSVPLVAMQFTDEVKWSLPDFVVMGAIIFLTGLSFKLVTRSSPNIVYKIGFAFAIGAQFLMIWANLAVGLIGSGPNPGNLMFIAVLLVWLVGTFLSNFKPTGMERAMYVTAMSVALLALIALLTDMQDYPGSGVIEILAVTGFFATLYVISGLLFRYAAKSHASFEKSAG